MGLICIVIAMLANVFSLEARSAFTLPNRALYQEEFEAWIAEYRALGGMTAAELEMLELINQHRAASGINSLRVDELSSIAARFHAQSQAQFGAIGHQHPFYGTSNRVFNRFQSLKPFTQRPARSPSVGHSGGSAQGALNWWRNSSEHWGSLMSRTHEYVGIGNVGSVWYIFFSPTERMGQVLRTTEEPPRFSNSPVGTERFNHGNGIVTHNARRASWSSGGPRFEFRPEFAIDLDNDIGFLTRGERAFIRIEDNSPLDTEQLRQTLSDFMGIHGNVPTNYNHLFPQRYFVLGDFIYADQAMVSAFNSNPIFSGSTFEHHINIHQNRMWHMLDGYVEVPGEEHIILFRTNNTSYGGRGAILDFIQHWYDAGDLSIPTLLEHVDIVNSFMNVAVDFNPQTGHYAFAFILRDYTFAPVGEIRLPPIRSGSVTGSGNFIGDPILRSCE
ncbi:MAG: CAP domain-containing protein [Turicibacter sp.]|nr:CAP domain-containing protein [Turicibacter sp.]